MIATAAPREQSRRRNAGNDFVDTQNFAGATVDALCLR
jgi:hypothetical protein